MEEPSYTKSTLLYGEEGVEYRFLYPEGLHWQCIGCGACCRDPEDRERHILLLPTDIERLREAGEKGFYEMVDGNEAFVAEMKKQDGRCIFHGKEGCKVYEKRPLICSTYPFWIERINNSFIFRVDEKCPGFGRGERLNENFFRQLLKTCLSSIGV